MISNSKIQNNSRSFYLNNFKKFFIGRDILIAREITKMHETYYRNSIKEIKPFKSILKGELTVVISKSKYITRKDQTIDESVIIGHAKKYLKKYSLKDVVELISKKENISKNKIYAICLKLKKNEKIN